MIIFYHFIETNQPYMSNSYHTCSSIHISNHLKNIPRASDGLKLAFVELRNIYTLRLVILSLKWSPFTWFDSELITLYSDISNYIFI